MNEYRIKAYAKINLGLDVVRRLENGYHEVKMVMQTVGIYDVLDFQRTAGGIVITTDSGELPTNEDNLIYKAAKLMIEKYHITEGVKIHLEKHIPIAAGMAGGSTDAAATLKGMNRLFDLGCTLKDLMELGVNIGADVPYCVMGGTALAEGIRRYVNIWLRHRIVMYWWQSRILTYLRNMCMNIWMRRRSGNIRILTAWWRQLPRRVYREFWTGWKTCWRQ